MDTGKWWEHDCKFWKAFLWCLWERRAGNTVKWTLCKKRIHKRCSGIGGDLSLVVDGFSCKRCDSRIQEADRAEDLVVDGETYGCVKRL